MDQKDQAQKDQGPKEVIDLISDSDTETDEPPGLCTASDDDTETDDEDTPTEVPEVECQLGHSAGH